MSTSAKVVGCLRSNVLTILNIMGVFGGVVLALILRNTREEKWTQREIIYVGFIGNSVVQQMAIGKAMQGHLIKLLHNKRRRRRRAIRGGWDL